MFKGDLGTENREGRREKGEGRREKGEERREKAATGVQGRQDLTAQGATYIIGCDPFNCDPCRPRPCPVLVDPHFRVKSGGVNHVGTRHTITVHG